jgi:RND family efflux transporter MFP subunit
MNVALSKPYFIMLAVLVAGVIGATAIVKSAPTPQKRAVERVIPLVEVQKITDKQQRPSWTAGATTDAKTKVALVAQVSGQITTLHEQAIPGAFLKKGSVLAKIDESTYRQTLLQKQASVVQAQANLDMELGQAQNALNDYKLSGMRLSKDAKTLALRKPQLASVKAALKFAKADLAKAKLDLKRTTLTMPFDGYVLKNHVNQGSYVNNNAMVFDVLASDKFWLEIKVPSEFASILDIDAAAHIKTLTQGKNDSHRLAKILSVLPLVDANDRQIKVLLEIESPLNAQPFSVRYGEYLEVTVFAHSLDDALLINNQFVNDDNTIWLVDAQSKLQKRSVDILYRQRDQVWLKAQLKEGDVLLKSPLPFMATGLEVRIQTPVNTQGVK